MKKILVIEDDIYIGNMVEEALRKNGYGVSRAYSGTEALLVIKDAVPDLILLDLMLPGITGEELLPKIKSIPVIVVRIIELTLGFVLKQTTLLWMILTNIYMKENSSLILQ